MQSLRRSRRRVRVVVMAIKRGDRIVVYSDPCTTNRAEGIAMVRKVIAPPQYRGDNWRVMVRFDGDDTDVFRFVNESDKVTGK